MLASPSLNYTQGYLYESLYKDNDFGGSRGGYGRSNGGRNTSSDRGGGDGGFGRGRGGGRFANF